MTKTLVTKKQFNSNPRSKELRAISLDIVKNVDALLHTPDVDKDQAYASIESLSGQLIGMGITPNMKTGLSEEAYRDPVTMAEYVAGQLLESTGQHIVSEGDVVPVIQEFSSQQSGNMHIIENKGNLPRPMKDFMVMRSVVNVAYRFLDED